MLQNAENHIQGTQVLKKAGLILGSFSFTDRHLSLSSIAQATGLPKTTVHRILHTLQQLGWVVSRQDLTYALGPALIELGGIARSSLDWREVLASRLNELSAKVRHAILVATLVDDRLLYVDKRDSQYPLRITTHLGQRRPPHFGAVGKALMAYLPDSEIERLLAKYPLEPMTQRTVVDKDAFRARLEAVRRNGYDIEYNEILEGIVGVAAPLFAGGETPVAAIGVAVPEPLLGTEGVEPLVKHLVEAVIEASEELGTRRWPPSLSS